MDKEYFEDAIAQLNTGLFQIETQTSDDDRRSLLAAQKAVRKSRDSYVYLECGSHLGGSLLPHLMDSRCRLAYSIDKRPLVQPDERGTDFHYPKNSTQRMVKVLGSFVPPENLAKLRCFDLDANELTANEISEKPDLVLIDAEHTNHAVFSDFLSLYTICGSSTVFLFHDANLIFSGLLNIETFLRYEKVTFESHFFPDVVFVLATDQSCNVIRSEVTDLALNRAQFLENAKSEIVLCHSQLVREQSTKMSLSYFLQRWLSRHHLAR